MSMSLVLRWIICVGLLCAGGLARAAITTPYFNDFSASEPFTETAPTGSAWNLNTGTGVYTNTFSTNGLSSSAVTDVTGLGGLPATALDFSMSSKFTVTANSGTSGNNTLGFAALSSTANPTANFLLADIGTNGNSAIIRLLRFNDTGGNSTIGTVGSVPALSIGTEYTMILNGTYTPTNELNLLFQLYNGATLVGSTTGTVSSTDVTNNLTGNNFGYRNRTNAAAPFAVAFNDFSITTPIPEPTTWAAGVAALGFLWWRRRKA